MSQYDCYGSIKKTHESCHSCNLVYFYWYSLYNSLIRYPNNNLETLGLSASEPFTKKWLRKFLTVRYED